MCFCGPLENQPRRRAVAARANSDQHCSTPSLAQFKRPRTSRVCAAVRGERMPIATPHLCGLGNTSGKVGWLQNRKLVNHGSHRWHGLGSQRIRVIRSSCSPRRSLLPAGSTEGARFISPRAKPWVTRTRSKSSSKPQRGATKGRTQKRRGRAAETAAQCDALCFTPLGCTTMAWRHGNQGFALAW